MVDNINLHNFVRNDNFPFWCLAIQKRLQMITKNEVK